MATEEEEKSEVVPGSEEQAKDSMLSGAPEGYKFLVTEPDFQAQFGLVSPPLFDYSLPDFVEKKTEVFQSSSPSSPAFSPGLPPEAASRPEPSLTQEPEAPNIPPLSLPVLLSLTPSDFSGPLPSLTEEQNELALQIFAKADLNANGFLEPDELKQALASSNFTASQKTILTIIKNVIERVLLKRSNRELPGGGEILTSQEDFCLALASEYSRGVLNLNEKRSLSTPVLDSFYHFAAGELPAQKVAMPGQSGAAAKMRYEAAADDAIASAQTNFRPELYGAGGVPSAAVRVRAIALNATSDPYFAALVASLVSLAPRSVGALLKENIDKSCDVVFNRRHEKAITVVPPSVPDIMRYGLALEYGYWFLVLDKAYGIYLATKSRLATRFGDSAGSFARGQRCHAGAACSRDRGCGFRRFG